MPPDQRRTGRLAVALLAVTVVLVVWWWVGQGSGGPFDGTVRAGTSATSAVWAAATAPKDASGMPRVQVADLAAQARQSLDLIVAGGPSASEGGGS